MAVTPKATHRPENPRAVTDDLIPAISSVLSMGTSGSPTMSFAVRGPIVRADLPGLFARVCELMAGPHGDIVGCDVAGVDPDVVAIEALARLELAARQHHCRISLINASRELLELRNVLGLANILHS
jgi:hypothetical protein